MTHVCSIPSIESGRQRDRRLLPILDDCVTILTDCETECRAPGRCGISADLRGPEDSRRECGVLSPPCNPLASPAAIDRTRAGAVDAASGTSIPRARSLITPAACGRSTTTPRQDRLRRRSISSTRSQAVAQTLWLHAFPQQPESVRTSHSDPAQLAVSCAATTLSAHRSCGADVAIADGSRIAAPH